MATWNPQIWGSFREKSTALPSRKHVMKLWSSVLVLPCSQKRITSDPFLCFSTTFRCVVVEPVAKRWFSWSTRPRKLVTATTSDHGMTAPKRRPTGKTDVSKGFFQDLPMFSNQISPVSSRWNELYGLFQEISPKMRDMKLPFCCKFCRGGEPQVEKMRKACALAREALEVLKSDSWVVGWSMKYNSQMGPLKPGVIWWPLRKKHLCGFFFLGWWGVV